MASMLFTLPNSADLGVVTAGSTAPGSSVSNLLYPQITSVWKSAPDIVQATQPSGYPGSRWLQYQASGATVDPYVALVALIADASRPIIGGATRKWRVRANLGAHNALADIVRPTPGNPTLTNLTGAQSPSVWLTPPSSWLTATSPTAQTRAVWTFATSQTDGGALPLKAGAGLDQVFSIWCRRSSASGTAPTVTVDLYESGSLVTTISSGTAINFTTGQLLQVRWNASLLSSLTTQTAGIRVTGNPGSASTVEFAAVEWQAEHNGYTVDSGDLFVAYPAYVATQAARVFPLAYLLPTPVLINAATSSVLIDQSDFNSAPGYAQQGRLVVANIVQPFVNMAYDWGISWDDQSPKSETPGRQEWFEVRPKLRIGELVCNALRSAEAWDQVFSELQGTVGITGNFLWMPDPATPAQYYNNTLWCRFDGLSPVKNPRLSRYSQSYKIKEVL